MHHLILLLPIIGIIVFWLMPLNIAIPSYLAILLVSGLMYWAILRAIRKVPTTGANSLVGMEARVMSRLGPKDEAQYLVEADGEMWSANSSDTMEPGETATIIAVEGIKLIVKRSDSQSSSSPGTEKRNAT
jgi:membrane protein implicated in regulation of membrane protease activity